MQSHILNHPHIISLEVPVELKNLVSLFLSELLRSRRASLSRAAEVASHVVQTLSTLKSEDDALALLGALEHEFTEVIALKQALHFGYREEDVHVYEQEIREYAATIFGTDMVLSSSFLKDAAEPTATIQTLCLKYPDFCQYLIQSSEKGRMVEEMGSR